MTKRHYYAQYIEVTQENAVLKDDPSTASNYDDQIAAISVIMEIFTFGLFLTFGAVALKKAFLAATSTKMSDVLAKIDAFFPRFLRRMWSSDQSGEVNNTEAISAYDGNNLVGSNPMHAKTTVDIEMTSTTISAMPPLPFDYPVQSLDTQ